MTVFYTTNINPLYSNLRNFNIVGILEPTMYEEKDNKILDFNVDGRWEATQH